MASELGHGGHARMVPNWRVRPYWGVSQSFLVAAGVDLFASIVSGIAM